ncbi:MAG: hypothetical protein LBD06_01810 [Candidatus Accumulibacter sp.]|jgi:hypothetical protein|nr:hypothetical protein [Accumulibacter sp.]
MPLTRLTLLVPELLRPDPGDDALDGLVCPALTALFERGRLTRRPPEAPETVLMGLFGHAPGTARAAFRLRGESEVPADAATARWLAADPVHLRLDGERLILTGGDALDIAAEEAAALIDALNGYFADSGVFRAARAERWYLRLAAGKDRGALERLDAPPTAAVAGRGVERSLLKIVEHREILKLINEIQTFLHAHPVNRRREENDQAPINSLWLWGGGMPPRAPAATDFDAVLSADALARGLARAAGLPVCPPPEEADALFARAVGACPLVALGGPSGALHHGNAADYRRDLAALETRWFAPAWRALAAGAIGRLRLVAPTAHGTLILDAGRAAARPAWRFWRRPRTLAAAARALAASAGEAA